MSRPTLLQMTLEDYRLVAFLGAGGMGEVYRAIDTRRNRVVAIKVLANRDPKFLTRFRNEARIQAALRHETIATFFDFLEYDGRPCIVMECVEGRTLYQHLQAEGPFPVPRALALFQEVVGAIAYMHEHHIVHRDIKASNIKITPEGRVKLLDFGIAKGPASPGLTATGAVIGTPAYLSPEQLKGYPADTQSDIWALGVLLYEMLTGHVPFEAANLLDLYGKISRAVFVPASVFNPQITTRINTIIARCLKKKPADRYASAQALDKVVARAAHPVTRSLHRPLRRVQDHARSGYAQARKALAALFPQTSLKPPTPPSQPPRHHPATLKLPTMHPPPRPARMKRAGIVLGGFALLAMLGYVLTSLRGSNTAGNDPASTLLHCSDDSTRQAGTFAVKIKVVSGSRRAQVVGPEGASVGTTPCWIRGLANTKASFVLQQEGFRDKTIYVDFHERRAEYAIPMDRAGR